MNVHFYPSILKNETRILKITRTLRDYEVFEEVAVVGIAFKGLPAQEDLGDGICLHRLAPVFGGSFNSVLGKVIRTFGWYLAVLLWLRDRRLECINCHSLPALPLSVLIKKWKQCTLVYDTHELETETHVTRGIRKILAKWVERVFISQADAVSVVNRSIAGWYDKTYRLSRVWVVQNLPRRNSAAPRRTGLLRKAIGLNSPQAMIFIYQGMLSPERGIEMLIDTFADISANRHLVFMGFGPLEDLVIKAGHLHANIHFMPAVAPDLVKDYTVDADVGFSLIENTCMNHFLCSPNKLYEYAACGVAPIVSDFPEMSRFVETYDCGWKTHPQVDALRHLILTIDSDSIKAKRVNAARAGIDYCWENEEVELLNIYEFLGFHRVDHSPAL